jgi:transposase-like protein
MAKTNQFAEPHFHDENAARAWFEAARWPHGPICPKCRSAKSYPTKKAGVYRCAASTCRKDFTVTTGTVMERSHAKFTQWAVAFHMAASSKKGFSAHQLHRELGCQYNTAWFMFHRVREAMRRGGLDVPPLGGDGKIVEADETYFGDIPEAAQPRLTSRGKPFSKRRTRGAGRKRVVVALVERGGSVRSFSVPMATMDSVGKIVSENLARETRLQTDESPLYKRIGKEFASHETVTHADKEYARGDVTTNTVEGYFSIFKRGMRGVYQHCAEKHLHRYLAEFDFRYNYRASLGYNDTDRTIAAVRGGEGKRLTYHQPHSTVV